MKDFEVLKKEAEALIKSGDNLLGERTRVDGIRKPKPKKLSRKEKAVIAKSLGLVKVRGSVSGKVYYE